jgi:hypothetical protein
MDDEKNTAMMNDEKKTSSSTEHWRDLVIPCQCLTTWIWRVLCRERSVEDKSVVLGQNPLSK